MIKNILKNWLIKKKKSFMIGDKISDKNCAKKSNLFFSYAQIDFYKQIKDNLNKIVDWKNISELIPKFYLKNEMRKTGMAGIFAASLELTKEGVVNVSQKKIFDKLMIKKS